VKVENGKLGFEVGPTLPPALPKPSEKILVD
jgi:hypothetical protein